MYCESIVLDVSYTETHFFLPIPESRIVKTRSLASQSPAMSVINFLIFFLKYLSA